MSVLNDLMDALPEAGGVLKSLDLGGLLDKVPDVLGFARNIPDISGILGPFDPIDLLSKVDLSGIVANVGETVLDFLAGVPGVRAAG